MSFAAGPSGSVAAYVTNSEAELSGGGGSVSQDGTGFGIKGWFAPAGGFFLQYEYQVTELDATGGLPPADLESLRFGGGLFHPLNPATGVYGYAQYVDFGSDFDQAGIGIHGGIHHQVNKVFGFGGTLGYLSLDDFDGPEISLGAMFNITQNWGVFAHVRTFMGGGDGGVDLDVTDIRVGGSFNFGM